MKEKILNIEEVRDFDLVNIRQVGYGWYDGYKIITNKHTYRILIENCQSCCEDFGYFSTNDDIKEFVNSDLISIDLIDMEESKLDDILKDKNIWGLENGGIQFVNFETSNGLLQFAVYNSHNGYYGHSIIVAKDTEVLKSDTL